MFDGRPAHGLPEYVQSVDCQTDQDTSVSAASN